MTEPETTATTLRAAVTDYTKRHDLRCELRRYEDRTELVITATPRPEPKTRKPSTQKRPRTVATKPKST